MLTCWLCKLVAPKATTTRCQRDLRAWELESLHIIWRCSWTNHPQGARHDTTVRVRLSGISLILGQGTVKLIAKVRKKVWSLSVGQPIRNRIPSRKRKFSEHPMVHRCQPVPRESEKIQNETVNRKELLSLGRRLAPSHLPLPPSGRLV